eukprot:10295602-Alexandrium_andersonii.AAC.1
MQLGLQVRLRRGAPRNEEPGRGAPRFSCFCIWAVASLHGPCPYRDGPMEVLARTAQEQTRFQPLCIDQRDIVGPGAHCCTCHKGRRRCV